MPSRIERAVSNNVSWYRAQFEAHRLADDLDGKVWWSRALPPPFHSNLVVLSAATSRDDVATYVRSLQDTPRAKGWSIKDSYASVDLSGLGFREMFGAEWGWRDAAPLPPSDGPAWRHVTREADRAEWEEAWWRFNRHTPEMRVAEQFPTSLWANPDFAFFASGADGAIEAGCVANLSHGVAGVSNLFSARAAAGPAWSEAVRAVASVFPGLPMVCYARDQALQHARAVGFKPIGPLRVWRWVG